jgi:hypothetical protein
VRCQFLGGGVIVCGGRQRLPNCSTPGCRRKGELSCDHPVQRNAQPKRGDTRVHKEHQIVFYVWWLHPEQGDVITIGAKPPPLPGSSKRGGQTIPIADWFAKSDATCDRPVCSSCSTRVGQLDLCQAHARALPPKETP